MKFMNRVWAVVLAPDGQTFAIGDSNGRIHIVDSLDYTTKYIYELGQCIYTVSFTSNGEYLAAGTNSGFIYFIDLKSSRIIKTLDVENKAVRSIKFIPESHTLIAACNDNNSGSIIIWDTLLDEKTDEFIVDSESVFSLEISSDGETLFTGGSDSTIKIWNLRLKKCHSFLEGHKNTILSLSLSPNQKMIASGSEDRTVKVWDIESSRLILNIDEHRNTIFGVDFDPSSSMLASGCYDGKIIVWNIEENKKIHLISGHRDYIRCISYSLDGSKIFTGSDDPSVKVWDSSSGTCIAQISGYENWTMDLVNNFSSSLFASAGYDHLVRLWDIDSQDLPKILEGHKHVVFKVAFNSQLNILASASADQTVRLWDINSSKCIQVIHGHDREVRSVVFHPSGASLFSCSEDLTIKKWSLDGICLKTMHDTAVVSCICISQDGRLVATGNSHGCIRVWCSESGSQIDEFIHSQLWINSITFSPNSKNIVFTSRNGVNILTLTEHSNILESTVLDNFEDVGYTSGLVFSENGELLVAASGKSLKIWRWSDKSLLHNFQSHEKISHQ